MIRSVLAGLASLAITHAAAAAPPVGVYSCYDATINFKGQLQITPTPFAMFGLIDGATYSDYDGHHGRYTYDAGSGTITMTDGARQGWRYRKTGDWAFTLIDNKTGKTIYTCTLETAKDPRKGPW